MQKKVKFILKEDVKPYLLYLYGWTLADLAEFMNLKKQQISPILNGRIEPSMYFLHKLCEKTGLKLENIIETKIVRKK